MTEATFDRACGYSLSDDPSTPHKAIGPKRKSLDYSHGSSTWGVILLLGILAASLYGVYIPSNREPLAVSHSLQLRSSTPVSVPSIKELRSYLHFAYAAFCPADTLQDWTCPWCLDDQFQITSILFNETTKTRGFVGFDPSRNITVASFRGSHGNVVNWWLDLEPGTTTEFYNVTIRKGWVLAYQALREQLWEALHQTQSRCPSCDTFVTTGHSLGAAISGLAALDAKLSFPWIQRAEMINFGMPRVGYKDFAKLFHDNVDSSFRVVHFRDIVPHYPLRIKHAFPFHHVGSELWEPQKHFNGTLRHCDGSGEDPHCSDSLPIWHWDPADHMNYLGIQNDNCEQ